MSALARTTKINCDTRAANEDCINGGSRTRTKYGYDSVSRLNFQSQTLAALQDSVSSSFGDNPADQIVSESVSNAEYASAATSTTQSYGVNGLNQYSTVAGVSFSWDPRGNLTSDGSTTYSYDLENHLTGASGTYTATLNYDPLGRLYQTTGGSVVTNFIYDGDRIAVEYDGSGNLLRRYAYGPGGDNPIVWYEGAAVGQSNRRYLHANHEGSIIAVTDSNGGTLAINRYDPYGIRGSSNQGRFQYTSQAYVPELGLYYYKARMYNATLGRFMQTDPVGYTGDLDLYTYVGNDPLDGTDPSGEVCIGAGECIDPGPPPSSGPLAAIVVTAGRTATSATRLAIPAIGVASATVGVAVITALFPSRLGSNDTCDNGNCEKGSNAINAKATGDPPVPGAAPGPETRGPTQQWDKSGGKAEADKDFDNLGPTDVRPIPGGRTGTLPDGRNVNVRDSSSGGKPTLEIQNGRSRIKVRYNQ